MPLRSRSPRPWSWEELREQRILAVYRAERDGRERTAVLVWQGDDRRVTVGDAAELLISTIEPGLSQRSAAPKTSQPNSPGGKTPQ